MSNQTVNTSSLRAEALRRKALRRRHLLQRQTIIFGSIVALLAIAGLAAAGVYLGVLTPPFERGFTDTSTDGEAEVIVPCPADGALPVALNTITVNVYNGGSTTGLAGTIAAALQNAGVLTAQIDNYTAGYAGATLIVTGREGVDAAYSVAALFPGATIELDPTRSDAVVDVILGAGYQQMNDPATATLDPTLALVGLEGCTAFTELPDPPAAGDAA